MNPHLRAIRISIEIQATRESRVNISIAIHLTRDTYVVYPFDARLQSGSAFVKRISQTCDTAVEVSPFISMEVAYRKKLGANRSAISAAPQAFFTDADRVRMQIAISSQLSRTQCYICIAVDNMVKHLF